MTVKTITFIRHGQSVANAGGVTMEHAAIPLSDLGERQAEHLATLLPEQVTEIWTSKFIRAQQTAEPYLRKVQRLAQTHPLVHEFDNFDPNIIAGMTGEERAPLREAYWETADPSLRMGGVAESFLDFESRVDAFLPVLQSMPDKTLVFGHGMWIGLLIWKLMGFTARDQLGMKAFRRFQNGLPMPNCAVYHFTETAAGQWRVAGDDVAMKKLGASK